MQLRTLSWRGASYYRRTNAAVVLGIACAVTVLAGALMVGESVRASLRELSLARLGRTDVVVTSETYFREALAVDLGRAGTTAAPVLLAEAVVTNERSRQRASRVQIVGVDERFWVFHQVAPPAMRGADAWMSPGLARELSWKTDDALIVRTRQASTIPAEFLHGRRDETGRAMRLRGAGILARHALGEFSVRPQQGEVRTLIVPMARLQRELDLAGRVNTVLLTGERSVTESALRAYATLDDLGLRVRTVAPGELALESERGLLDDVTARVATDVASRAGVTATPMFTYVVNTIRVGDRSVPYSLVTGVNSDSFFERTERASGAPAIAVNEWAADELRAKPGDLVTVEFYVWAATGRLETRSAEMRLSRIVPMTAADRDFAPFFPGISDTDSLSDWDPPFPVDLSRVRRQDEAYWERYRTLPKAFVPLDAARDLWGTRWGRLTALRLTGVQDSGALTAALRDRLAPAHSGLVVVPVREEALRAATGATDFGAYFTYFSFFITASALLLAGLFFRLGLEQRIQEVGLLRAIGYSPRRLRSLFLVEAGLLAAIGSVAGVIGAIGYAWLIMFGLRTWWVGAVGTTLLELHPSWFAMAAGVAGGATAGLLTILYTLRAFRRASPRALLTGDVTEALKPRHRRAGRSRFAAAALAGTAALLATLAAADRIDDAAGFFGAGTLLLGAALCLFAYRLAAAPRRELDGARVIPVGRLGLRYASFRRGRSVLSAALIAGAVFLVISVEAFRRDAPSTVADRHSGTGGAALVAESLLPVIHDPESAEGREALNLRPQDGDALPPFSLTAFRLSEGDDVSCVNLYRPQRPRLIGAPARFIAANRFSFKATAAASVAERENPWLLLRRREEDGAVPAIADATSLQYVLHRAVGDELDTGRVDANGNPVRLRIVASLADSVLQGEIVIADEQFRRTLPNEAGYRFFLVDIAGPAAGGVAAAAARNSQVAARLEERLSDFGFDATNAADRLAAYHRVENTYLSTFQALGALGLLLGTIGLGAIAVRNVLERRRELGLLRAVGYRAGDLGTVVLAENALLLLVGIGSGIAAALLAIAPVLMDRGGRPLTWSLAGLVLAVLAAGLGSSAIAARATARASLLSSLRSD
jgi:putative ABC transport system permease protein